MNRSFSIAVLNYHRVWYGDGVMGFTKWQYSKVGWLTKFTRLLRTTSNSAWFRENSDPSHHWHAMISPSKSPPPSTWPPSAPRWGAVASPLLPPEGFEFGATGCLATLLGLRGVRKPGWWPTMPRGMAIMGAGDGLCMIFVGVWDLA